MLRHITNPLLRFVVVVTVDILFNGWDEDKDILLLAFGSNLRMSQYEFALFEQHWECLWPKPLIPIPVVLFPQQNRDRCVYVWDFKFGALNR